MPKVSEMIQSKFLRKEDIEDEMIVTIRGVRLEAMPGDGSEQRWVVQFKELPKGLVMNRTTIGVLDKAFGGHSDDWLNKKVVLYIDESVQFKGKVVGGLRLRPVKTPKAPTAAELDGSLEKIPLQ